MATSGSKSITVGTGLTLKFSWSRSSVDTANNKSTVSWQMDLITTSGNINSSASKTWSVVVNGTSYSGTNTIGIAKNSTKKLASGSTTISHNADGTKTFSYSFSQTFNITYSGSSITSKSGSGSGTLDPISRVSSVAATNAYIGSNTTITITRHNSGFKHTLQYKLPGQSSFTTIVSKTADTTYSWKLDDSKYGLYELIPNAKSMTITINCITYNGDTKIGEKTTTLKASCKESLCAPYFYEPEVEDMNDTTVNLTGDPTVLVRYYSKAQVHSNPHAQNEAEITDNIISNNTTAVLDSVADFDNITSGSFELYTKDSRGFEKRQTLTAPMVNYVKLTCVLEVAAPTADGKSNLTVKGNCFSGNFGATDNTLKIELRMKLDDGDWTTWENLGTPTVNDNKYNITMPLQNLNYKSKYTFQARATDKLATKNSKEISVKTAPIFDWSAEDFKFNVPVYMDTVKLAYTPGDEITIGDNTPFAGYVSNSKKTMLFSIPLNKPLVGITSATVSGKFECRGITGNLYNPTGGTSIFNVDNKTSENLTVNVYVETTCLRITITANAALKTSADGTATISNNTPITVMPYDPITITFA